VGTATLEDIDQWANENDKLVSALDKKIRKLPTITSDEHRQEFRHRLLKWYLEGQEILSNLRQYPDTYEKVIKAKSHRENFLVTTTMLSTGSPSEILIAALQGFLDTVRQEAKEVSKMSSEALAHEAVADWMIRCPLDFPERELV
jgi:hypothetical protein